MLIHAGGEVGSLPGPGGADVVERACRTVSQVCQIAVTDPGVWLAMATDALATFDPARFGVTAMIGQAEPGGLWTCEHAAVRLPGLTKAAEQAALDELRAGSPQDDLPGPPGRRAPAPTAWVCDGRPALVHEMKWRRCAHRTFRTGLGLHEFIRAVCPLDEPGSTGVTPTRFLVLQFDAMDPAWTGEDGSVGAARGALRAASDRFVALFVAPERRKRRMYRALTPIRRNIADLLMAGHTERGIARMLDRSRHTIHDHVMAIYSALNVSSRQALADAIRGADAEEQPTRAAAASPAPLPFLPPSSLAAPAAITAEGSPASGPARPIVAVAI